ncbi:Protein FLX-like [Parasponia andersonii]|uniref:Protein FLX-like n=1 Tax=Parasponia andersonii TaxID=3476 RepID=A0A2P5AVJ9_PARAD|nr:Protein FLX-like [Parasponia andersonii]
MGSKGRIPPPHLRRPLPGPAMGPPEPFGPGIHPPPGGFPPFDMLPPPEVMEQKLAAQHVEMQRLATENQRLASTHGTLRQELAGAQHELQMLHAQIGAVKSEREQQMRNLTEKIAKMEADLKAAEPVKLELQKARAEAQSLVATRQELISKGQQLSQELQRTHTDVQQIPALMAELDSLRQEYQHCRASYDYEKKLYNDHLESLQLMETNYITMAREVEKLRGELMNPTYVDRRPQYKMAHYWLLLPNAAAPYGGTPGNNENEASGHPVGQNAYEDGYAATQGRATLPSASGAASATVAARTPTYVGVQSVPASARPVYDAPRGSGYDAAGASAYDPHRGHGYDAQLQRGTNYDGYRGPGYDAQRPAYDMQRGPGYDVQRGGPGYDVSKVVGGYDSQSRGGAAPHGHVAPKNHAPYGSATPPPAARSGNPVRK